MSSIRVKSLRVSKGDLEILDKFMEELGFELYPAGGSEPADMPWSTRWYRPETTIYTNGKRGHLHITVDIAMFWNQHTVVKNG